MQLRHLPLPLVLLAATAFAQNPPTCKFEAFRYPGMNLDTWVTGINQNQVIVGSYTRYEVIQYQDVPVAHGFMRRNGAYFPIDVPGAQGTVANGINDRGQIVGRSHTPKSAWHGFILNSSGYHKLKVPGFPNVSPEAINNIGEIVGYASRYDGTVLVQKGFILSDGKLNIITFPGSSSTGLAGINKEGTIVGSYGSPDGTSFHGLLLKDGVFSTLDYPGSTWTSLSGINDEGAIIGVYYIIPQTGFWTVNPFMWKNGVFTVLPPHGTDPTYFQAAANENNQFIGFLYPPPYDRSYSEGFVASCTNVF